MENQTPPAAKQEWSDRDYGRLSIGLSLIALVFQFGSINAAGTTGWFNFNGCLPGLVSILANVFGFAAAFPGLIKNERSIPCNIGFALNCVPILIFIVRKLMFHE